jgi:hypothetical protein
LHSYQYVWREGFAPLLSLPALEALAAGLARNDPALIQGRTMLPEALMSNAEKPLTAADPVVYAMWKAGEIRTVAEADEAFNRLCYEADMKLGEPAAVRYHLNWWDDEPRALVFRELYSEVTRTIAERKAVVSVG